MRSCPRCGEAVHYADFVYCTVKCKEQAESEEQGERTIRHEVDKLLEQYGRGGWHPEDDL